MILVHAVDAKVVDNNSWYMYYRKKKDFIDGREYTDTENDLY